MSASYGSFSGTVTDQGAPVASAIVEALSGGLIAGIAVTDTSGSYTLWVPGGPGYTVQASQIWRTTTSVTSQSVTAGGNTTVNLTLPSMLGTIAGTVTDSNSNPIAGAQISASSSIYSATATTNGSGNYSIPRLFLGTYSVTASASGYPSSTTNGVSTSADTTTTVNFQLTATGESQTITFGALSNQAFGTAPFNVSATASSGLSVSFNSQTMGVCTVSGSTVTLVSVGTCTIQATQAGNSNWAAATPVNQSFQVTQGSQTITFGALSNAAMGTTPTVSASASSGLAVSFNSQTTPVCTVSGSTVTLVAVGTCTIQATQAGNSNWAAAAPVNQSFQVTQGTQAITFGAPANAAMGTTPTVSASASSGLAVSFNSQTTPVCTVSGSTVTLVSVGTCTIQATQAGNSNWAAATSVNQSFQVTQGSQTITFGALANAAMGTTPTVSASASSGFAVSFNSQTTGVCTVSGSTVTLVAVGTCTIQATQAGNGNWAVATPVNQSFQVTQGSQTITFGALANAAMGTAPTVSATASSGLAVSFNSQTTGVCTVSGSTVTLVSVGTCTIQATQAGNSNWAAATPVNQSFQVTQGSQTITFGALANEPFGSAAFPVSATATSGLAVSFNSQTTPVCTLSGSTVTLVSVGTCTIQATQAGNSNWAAATPVNQSFQVTQGSQTITFGALSNAAMGTAPTVSASASSGLAVSFNSQTTGVCTVSGSTVTLVAVGTCTIQATQAGNGNWAAATPVNQGFQVTQGSQTITFGALSNEPFGTAAFPVSATATSGLAVSFNSQTTPVCTVSGSTVTLVSVGTCTIQATQAGNGNWAAANPVNQGFQVTQGSQTITFGALSNEPFGTAAFPVSATATSGLAVSFNSQTTPVCTVSGSTVTLVSVGTCTIQATQAGNSNWAAATPVNQSFQVTQGSQTITFGALSNEPFGTAAFPVSATATSGLAVSFNSQTTPVCTVSGSTVTLVSVGTCTIQATQAGNSNWAAATPVNQSFQVTQGNQTITFAALSNKAFGSAAFNVSATATSGLAVSFNSQSTGVCTVSGSTVTLVSVGTCTIQATQAGNSNWAAATSVNQSFQVTQGSQTITFGALPNEAFGTVPFGVTAIASSGLAVSFNSQTAPVCTVSGSTVTLVSVGTCTIQASQAGNSNWAAATPVNQSFQVTQGSQTITFGALSNEPMGTTPFTVSATASSGLSVSFNSQTTAVCTVTGSTVTLVSVGTCTIQATQAGNTNYAAATPVNQSFQVTQGSQMITFGALSNEVFGTAPFGVSASASSGLAVSFNSQTTAVCTVTGSTVTLVAVGTCTIQATQAGNTNWAAATAVNQSFQVTQGSQTITFGALSNEAFGTAAFAVSASASSGLAVSFNSQTTGICTVSGSMVTLVAVGTCMIQATQAGNSNWAAATPVNQGFQVMQGNQTITFAALSNKAFGTAAFNVSATTTSGLAVSFNSQTTAVCTVSGTTVTLVAVGTCTIQATQAGNGNWAAATPANQSFQVTQGSQTITFGALSNEAFGTAAFNVGATASSGLAVSFNSQTTGICTVLGSTVTLVAVGTCTIQATQAGNSNWAAATPVNQSFQVTQGSQTITFGALSNEPMGTTPFTVSATATSGLSVSFNSQTTGVCTVTGSTVTLVSVGICTIQATQSGNSNWAAATPVNQSFQVTQGSQTITFGALSNAAMGSTPTVSATASSGLTVSFTSQTTSTCTVSGTTVTLVTVGTCTIQATQAGNSNWAAATPVNQSFQVTQGSQTITFGALSNEAFGSSPFLVSASASSGLAVSFTSTTSTICTVSGASVTLVSVGTCTIQATQSGNSNWAAATPVNQSFQVTQGSQTITFGALSNAAMGTVPTVSASASSGLSVSFNSQTTPVCTVSGSTVTMVSVGTCTIQATQAGNTNYAAATPVNQSFQVTQGSQTIAFGALTNEAFGTAPFPVSATASSGLTVSFTSQSTGVCTVSGSTVTLVAVGTCTIQATQAGNSNWAAATPVNQSFQVTQGSQTITFGALSNEPFGTAPFGVSATASSGLSVSFNSQTTGICTVSGSTVTLVSVGTCTIQATQAGNSNWAAATPVNQSFQVTQGSQTITFGALSNAAMGTAPTVSATASSGLSVSFNSQTTAVCTVSGSTVTLVSVGTCTIQAAQAGNSNWASATPVNQSFQVTQGSQTITFAALSNAAMGTAPTVSATASSGLTVSFNSQTTGVCTVSGSTVTLVAVGTCTIQAIQAGNSNWVAATPVNQSFQVTQGSQTITFGALSNEPMGTTPSPVSASTSSGLAVSFNSQTTAACTISGPTVTLVSVGTCTIQATQAGNTNWAAAAPVNQSFQVTQGSQTIAFVALSNEVFGTAPFGVSATASSGLAVSFNSQTTPVCTVSGSTVTLVAVGTCTIQATQAGNSNWAAATPVNQSFQVTQGSQTITFGALSNEPFGTAAFPVSASATSGLAVSFNSQTTTVCTVSGSTVTLVSVGTCTIQVTRAGNSNWAAATPVNQSFQVTQGSQTITFGALSNAAMGTAPTVSASVSSGLAVNFNSQTTAVCTVSGSTVTLVSVGTCTIQATQAGNSNWAAATPVNQSFQVTQGSQTIPFGALSNEPFGTAAFPVSATATSGLTVSFNSQTTPVCTVSGSTVTLVSVGTCTIQATQAGNSNWAAATSVNQSFQVTQGSQTITFGALSNAAMGTAPTVSASASSGLSVSFNSQTTPVCTISGSTVTLVSVGTCTIQATQAGNINWTAATPVNQSFQVTQGSQTGPSPCAVSGDGTTSIVDVQTIVNQALGVMPAVNDLNQDGVVSVADVQMVLNSVLGLGCPSN
jgi:hypothetical protein